MTAVDLIDCDAETLVLRAEALSPGNAVVAADEGQRPVVEVAGVLAASNPARNLLVGNATIFALIILNMV